MILYHGSYLEIQTPDLLHSRENVDFGRGFYTTPLYDQAVKWCEKFKRRGKNGIVSRYSFEEKAYQELKILRFESYSEEWLDFILKCRTGNDRTDYDIVIGGVANDKVFNTVELYFDNLIDKKEAIRRLRYGDKPMTPYRTAHLLDGPGKVCRGLGLTTAENGMDLTGRTLFVCTSGADVGLSDPPPRREIIVSGPRIGVDYAEEARDYPWRFQLKKEDG